MATPTNMLDHVDAAFRCLCRGPDAPSLDGRLLGRELPQRPVGIIELRGLLLRPQATFETRDRALGWMATRARDDCETWGLAFLWMVLPGLRHMATRLVHAGADRVETGAEVVAGALSALGDRPLGTNGIAASVCWHAYRRARRGLRLDEPLVLSLDRLLYPLPAPPSALTANPEEVLAVTVRAGMLAPADAEVVAASRFEGRALAELAAEFGISYDNLQKRRARAETRIVKLLDESVWGVVPRGGRFGARWGRALARRGEDREAALSYRSRPAARAAAETPTLPPSLWEPRSASRVLGGTAA